MRSTLVASSTAAVHAQLRPPTASSLFGRVNAGKKRVPLYGRSRKIDGTVTIDKNVKPGTVIRVAGALNRQTCDERIVFARRTMRCDGPSCRTTRVVSQRSRHASPQTF